MFNIDSSFYSQNYSEGTSSSINYESNHSSSNIDNLYSISNTTINSNGNIGTKSKGISSHWEPPYKSVTVSVIQSSSDSPSSIIQKGSDVGPVSLVGWPIYNDSLNLDSAESTFELADGTGSIMIRIDVQSDKEHWLLDKIKLYVMGSRAADFNLQTMDKNDIHNHLSTQINYLRVVGSISWDTNLLSIRCIHLRLATPEEITFHHHLEIIWYSLKTSYSSVIPKSTQTHTTNDTITNHSQDNTSDLPDIFNLCRNPCQQSILRYIFKNRIREKGVLKPSLFEALEKDGYSNTDIQYHIYELMEMSFCMDTFDNYIDLVLEDDY